jgi:hypothetical protein
MFKNSFHRVHCFSLRMMEAARTSVTSVDNCFTRQYIPEDNSDPHTFSNILWQSVHSYFHSKLSHQDVLIMLCLPASQDGIRIVKLCEKMVQSIYTSKDKFALIKFDTQGRGKRVFFLSVQL